MNHRKVIENYVFMVVIRFFNSFFYLLIYPFLIRVLGQNSLGLFLFATSIATYFQMFITFGFDFPAVKEVSLYPQDRVKTSFILSSVLTGKLYLSIISFLILLFLLLKLNFFSQNSLIFIACFFNALSISLLPTWYFQGIQKMHYITIAQVLSKIAAIPVIFFLIRSATDCGLFALIIMLTNIIACIYAYCIIIFREKNVLFFQKTSAVLQLCKDSFPFFISSSASMIKCQFASTAIGFSYTMSDVAIYDLANKIINLPMTFISMINNALFPKVVKDGSNIYIRNILKLEYFISLFVIVSYILFADNMIQILGGDDMEQAYPLVLILLIIIPCWLIVGCYINFVYVPNGLYNYVLRSQIFAFLLFLFVVSFSFYIKVGIEIFALAMSVSAIFEYCYNYCIVKKNKLL